VLEDWDLWIALNRLRIVVEMNVYLDLGVDEAAILSAIADSYSEAILGSTE
jgi:hypothetical protein